MATQVTPLRVTDNASILDAIWQESTDLYQARIPQATQAGIRATLDSLTEFRPQMNEFIGTLVNRIGTVIARNMSWSNPFAEFKRGMLAHGNTIEEIQVGLIEAHTYDPDREYMEKSLFGTSTPPTQSLFHRINRQNFYPVTVNEMLLRRAFLEDGGLSSYVSQLLNSPITSDNWDEFIIITKLFAEYERLGGFWRVAIPEINDDSSSVEAKMALRKIREYTDILKFISVKYNAAHFPIAVQPDELILFTTPAFKASLDVDALAAAFNMQLAQIAPRIITIPEEYFGIEGCQAILTTRDFFVIADTLLENTTQYNPVKLQTNFFLHHQEILSCSLFAPAIMFTTNMNDEVVVTMPNITSVADITLEAIDGVVPTSVARGGMVACLSEGIDANGIVNSGVKWTVTGNASMWTYITDSGVLHIAPNETATSVTVHAFSAWVNLADPRADAPTKSLVVNIDANPAANAIWPEVGTVTGITIHEALVPVVDGTTTYALSLKGLAALTVGDVVVESSGVSVVSVDVADVAGGWTVTVVTDAGPSSAPVTYTVNVTNT